MKKITIETMEKLFKDRYIFTADYLKNYFGCSYQYLWINLKKVGYYSSFTHNAKYYTLADIPEFNQKGIWFYTDSLVGKIGFTRHKTAPHLIISLINSSEAGMCASKISEIMNRRVCNQLNVLLKKAKIERVKIKKRYYYFSKDEKRYNEQYSKLRRSLGIDKAWQLAAMAEENKLIEQGYKHKSKRLSTSRENWRQRSNEKQKKLRKQLIRIRDLERSRDKWKVKAMKYKGKVQELNDELKSVKKNSSMQII